ncbi:MAG: TolC family protein [Rhodothermales bacterium]
MNMLLPRTPRLVLMLAVFAVSLALMPARAQAQQIQQITFDDAVRIALDQNYLLKRAANTVELQSISVSRQRMSFFPNLNLNGSAGQGSGRNFIQELGEIISRTTNSVNSSISSGVNVFNGFGDVASLKQARLQRNASELDYERQRQTVVFTVMSNYLTLIERREQIRIQEENLEAQQQQLTQIEEFVRVGSRPMSDLFAQQATTAQAEASLLDAQRLYQLSEISLIQTLQLDPFGRYEFAIPEADDAALVAERYDVRAMLQNAFDRRYDLQAQRQDIDAALQGIRVARSGYWPSLNFSISSSFRYTDSRDQVDFSTQFFDERSTSLGFSVNVPLFDRFVTRNNVQQARVQLQNAQLDLENMRQDIALQVRQGYLDYLTDEKRLDVTEKQLRSAQQALEAEQERYNVGASTLVELTQARSTFVQASSDRIEAKYNFLFRKRLIEYYIGVLDPTRPLFE